MMVATAESECTGWLSGYSDLPMEIILHIFRFLNHGDLQAAGATCRRWYEALHDPEFINKTVLHFTKVTIADLLSPALTFISCSRPFRNFYFEEVTFTQMQQFMAHIAQAATVVTFDNVDLGDRQFYSILQQLPLLRVLNVTRCSHFFMSGSFLDGNMDDISSPTSPLANVRHLSLRHNQYLSDAIFLRLTSPMKCIDTLDMSGCHIAYHSALQRRFYPDENQAMHPSESILTFKLIMHVLTLHREHIRELNLSHTLVGAPALVSLSQIGEGKDESDGNGLRLLRLRLASCGQLNTISVKTFLQTQPQLLVLDLSGTACVNDDCMEAVVTATPLLEEVNFSGCNNLTNNGVALLGTLKHLRHLNISHCDGISSDGITLGIARTLNTTMKELQMSYLKVCDECIKCVARNLPNLRVLNVSHCVNAVTDDSVQCIIQHLRWLRELELEDCFRVTDTALTGIRISKVDVPKPSMENFHPPPTSSSLLERENLSDTMHSMKISLRSKAEEEIVRDANRKKAMIAAYELNMISESDIEGHNIQELRGLRILNLKGCNKITDVSLKYGLKLLELKRLSLSNCQQISYIGMEIMVLNCPSIEQLDLSDCYNINDKTIQITTSKLQRLRELHISGCTQLTDHSLDAILVNCKRLQTLSVYRCRRIYTDIEERLTELPSLRNLNMDNASSIDNAEIFRLKKRLDY